MNKQVLAGLIAGMLLGVILGAGTVATVGAQGVLDMAAGKRQAQELVEATTDAKATQDFTASVLAAYEKGSFLAQSAPQETQVSNEAILKFSSLQVAQNARIIEQNEAILKELRFIAKK